MKSLKFILIGLSLLVLLSGCNSNDEENRQSSKPEQVFRKVESSEISTIDIPFAIDSTSQRAVYNIFEGFYRLGEKNELLPAGASELPKISTDGRNYTIKLNAKAKWSDNVPVKAADYVYAWRRMVDPKTKSEGAAIFLPVKNAEKIMKGELPTDQLGIQEIKDNQIKITLEEAVPYFETLLVTPYFFPQREDIIAQYGDEYGGTEKKAVYNGPFIIEEYESGGTDTSWSYKKNDGYWDAKNVSLDRVENTVVKDSGTAASMYEDGEVDEVPVTGESVAFYKDRKDFSAELRPNVYYLNLNQKSEQLHFDNIKVRKAISYSLDRESIADKILNNGSIATNSFVPSKLSYSPKDQTDFTSNKEVSTIFSTELAHHWWEEFLSESAQKEFEIKVLVTDTESSKKIAEYIQSQLQETLKGLTVTITTVPYSVELEKEQQGEFDISLDGWGADYLDPMSYLSILQSNNSANYSNYSSEGYDKLIDQIDAASADPEKRWQLMLEAEEKIAEDLPVIPLFQYTKNYLRRGNVQNAHSLPLGFEFDYKNFEIN